MKTLVILVGVLLTLATGAAAQTLYRWIDERGATHFTDNPNSIPTRFRQGAAPVGALPREPPARPTPPIAREAPREVPPPAPPPIIVVAPPPDRYAMWASGIRAGEYHFSGVYETQRACHADRDSRTAFHISQGLRAGSEPGVAIKGLGVAGIDGYAHIYTCLPAGVQPR